jgi:hypothetical protein
MMLGACPRAISWHTNFSTTGATHQLENMGASIGHDLVFPNDLIRTKQENIIHLKSKRTYNKYTHRLRKSSAAAAERQRHGVAHTFFLFSSKSTVFI